MTTTPENTPENAPERAQGPAPDSHVPAAPLPSASQPTQPIAPVAATQPLPQQPAAPALAVPQPAPQADPGQYPTAQIHPPQPVPGAYAQKPARPQGSYGYPPQQQTHQAAAPVGGPVGPHAAGEPRRRTWIPVVGAAAAAALLASVGTAGLLTALDHDGSSPTSLSDVGRDSGDWNRTVPVANSTSENPDWEAVTKAVAPSVVSIQVQTQQGGGEGSGLVIDSQGHVLTNNHVVSGATNDTVQVTLSDGRLFQAKIVGTDPTTDLAVVKLKDAPDDLKPVTLGDSDDVTVGESVLAVGNPLGLANTATTGIVSALDRPVSASGESGGSSVVTNAIQIDAAVNPGNSGGPLFNAQGEVIGITSSIATMSNGGGQSGSIGLGFAIPVNLAKSISAQLIENGHAEHAFLGVNLSDATATADGVTRRGAKVEAVTGGSPAAKAGIKAGDVIVAIDDNMVSGAESLTAFVRERAAGDAAALTVVRDGKATQIDVTLAAKAAEDSSQGQAPQDRRGQQGAPDHDEDGQQGDPTNPNNVPNPEDWFFGGRG